MAFGKVIIRSESGVVEEFELAKPVTSVGRQPGNDIVLNTTAVSRYHARFDAADGQVYLVDLGTVNGTFINDKPVPSDSRVALLSGDVVQMGDMTLIFTSPEARQRFDISLTPSSTTVEHPSVPFRMVVDDPHQVVAPGARMQLVVQLQNLVEQELHVSLAADGMNPNWLRFSRQDILLIANETAEVLISIQPPRATTTRPGRYPLTIRAMATDEADSTLEVIREIDVVGYAGLAMVAGVQSRGGVYHLAVQNQGNLPLSIALEGFDERRLLSYQARPGEIVLSPGETRQARMFVQPRRKNAVSEGQSVPFVIVARATENGTFRAPVLAQYRPSSPGVAGWLAALSIPVILGLFVGIAALIFIALYAMGVGPFKQPLLVGLGGATSVPPTPAASTADLPVIATLTPVPTAASNITRFEATPARTTYRTSGRIIFTWEVVDARSVRLTDPAGNPLPLPESAAQGGTYEFPVASLRPGPNQFNLIVVGSDNSQETQLAVVITQWQTCTASPAASLPRVEPNLDADPAPPLPEPAAADGPVDVVVTGRTPLDASEGLWLLVAYDDLINLDVEGWLPAAEVQCPAEVNPENYAVIPPDTNP